MALCVLYIMYYKTSALANSAHSLTHITLSKCARVGVRTPQLWMIDWTLDLELKDHTDIRRGNEGSSDLANIGKFGSWGLNLPCCRFFKAMKNT